MMVRLHRGAWLATYCRATTMTTLNPYADKNSKRAKQTRDEFNREFVDGHGVSAQLRHAKRLGVHRQEQAIKETTAVLTVNTATPLDSRVKYDIQEWATGNGCDVLGMDKCTVHLLVTA